jgi:regulation of enolase protein 1 (concanavalin A-like superfamily)
MFGKDERMALPELPGLALLSGIALGLFSSGCDDSDPAPRPMDAGVEARPVDAPARDAPVGDGASAIRDLPPYERAPAAPPPTGHGWLAKDIGDLGANPGRLAITGPVMLRAGGMDIGGAADSCAFVYRKLTGDGEIVARVRSVQRADAASTAGIMVRADENDPASASVYFGLLADPLKGGQFVVRSVKGQPGLASAPDPQIRNQYLRLRREGRRFTLSRSSDRIAWVKVGQAEVDMPPEVAFGLAVSARHAMTPTEGEFDFVRLLGLDAAAAQDAWDVEPLGISAPLPVATIAGGRVAISGSGDELTTTFDNGAALLAPRTGNLMITARVEAVGAANTPKARVALMLREGSPARLQPTGRHVLISVNAQGVVQFQRRDRSTNFDPGQTRDGLRPPLWLRLARVDDPATSRTTVTGYFSADGNTWTRLDGAYFATPDPILAGVLFSSGAVASYSTAQLSNFAFSTMPPVDPIPPGTDAGAVDGGDAGGGQ